MRDETSSKLLQLLFVGDQKFPSILGASKGEEMALGDSSVPS